MSDEQSPIKYLPLRKKDSALSESDAWDLLCSRETPYGFLGMHGLAAEGGMPYAVPMNFSAEPAARAIYMHTTLDAGSKHNRAAAEDNRVTFTAVSSDSAIVPSPDGIPCRFTMKFASVMAFGRIEPVEDPAEKARILDFFMEQKSGAANVMKMKEAHTFITTIFKIKVEHISGARKA